MEAEDAIISDELITRASLMECGSPRPPASAIAMAHAGPPRKAERGQAVRGTGSSRPTASSRWMAIIARLDKICDLADKYDALVMVDDSHAVGFIGEDGRGTPEACGVEGRYRHPDRNPGARPSAAPAAVTPAAARRSSICFVSAPGLSLLEFRGAAHRCRVAQGAGPGCVFPPNSGSGCARTPITSARR